MTEFTRQSEVWLHMLACDADWLATPIRQLTVSRSTANRTTKYVQQSRKRCAIFRGVPLNYSQSPTVERTTTSARVGLISTY